MTGVRVLRVIARMNVGGPAVQISGLMRGLPSEGFEQILLTGYVPNGEQDFLETQAPDVEAVRVEGLSRSIGPYDDARAFASLVRHIRDFKPDIVHTHTAKAGVLGRIAARVAWPQAKIVHSFHGHLLHGYFGPRKTRVMVAIERELARMSDALVAVGSQVRDDLVAAGVGKTSQFHLIPPGLALPAPPSRARARAELGLAADPFVVSFIGRLVTVKRPDRFADVVERVHFGRPDIVFAVAGEGDAADALRARILQGELPVHMLGWRSDIETVLAASDCVVLTSDNEGTPLSLIQAGMAGLPVVSTDVGSISEIVDDGVTGLLAPTDAGALAEAVLRLANDEGLAHAMGSAGRILTTSRYGVGRLVRDHAALYHTLLGDHGR